jgi:Fe-S-cluster containining protein
VFRHSDITSFNSFQSPKTKHKTPNEADIMLLLTWRVIENLLQSSVAQQRQLSIQYERLPATRCRRKTHCCSMLPEMTFVETLAIFRRIAAMESEERLALLKKISKYFFLNAAQITACPFLDGQTCRVYQDRFFGCRAYGLWSSAHYRKIVTGSQTAKRYLKKQWLQLGVRLPRAVVDFQIPYCLDVQTVEGVDLNDAALIHIADALESVSRQFSEAHQVFQQSYFSDFSFLVAALLFGHRPVVQIKFEVVKEFLDTGNAKKLDRILKGVVDPCMQPAGTKSIHQGGR